MSVEIIGLQSIDVFRNEVVLLLINETIESGYDLIKDLLEKHNIPEEHITKTTFPDVVDEKGTMEATVEYQIISKKDFESKSKEEQIRFVLNRIGYKNENIKSIEYRKYNEKSTEPIWVVSLMDKEFHFYWDSYEEDPYSSICDEQNFLKNLYDKITSALDFDILLDILPN